MNNGKQIADTTLAQLGNGRFIAMTGARDFTYDAAGTLTFRLPRGFAKNKATHVRIALDAALDLYVVEFLKYNARALRCDILSTHERVHVENLRDLFTRETGLDCSL
jgi:hypothetical protein